MREKGRISNISTSSGCSSNKVREMTREDFLQGGGKKKGSFYYFIAKEGPRKEWVWRKPQREKKRQPLLSPKEKMCSRAREHLLPAFLVEKKGQSSRQKGTSLFARGSHGDLL